MEQRDATLGAILPATMGDSEADIIRAIVAGDADRYAELVDRYQAAALRVAFSFVGNCDDAKDIAQEAFVSAYQALGRFRGEAKFSTWLFRIIVNKCKDSHKQRARRPLVVAHVGEPDPEGDTTGALFVDVDDPAAGPSEQLSNRELAQRLSEAIAHLPMKQRTAFLLHHVHGCSLEEAAEMMACRVGTVKAHLFRATASLRAQLAPWVAQEGRSWTS